MTRHPWLGKKALLLPFVSAKLGSETLLDSPVKCHDTLTTHSFSVSIPAPSILSLSLAAHWLRKAILSPVQIFLHVSLPWPLSANTCFPLLRVCFLALLFLSCNDVSSMPLT